MSVVEVYPGIHPPFEIAPETAGREPCKVDFISFAACPTRTLLQQTRQDKGSVKEERQGGYEGESGEGV